MLDWLEDVKNATEETLFPLADHLPSEASEALLELATGGEPMVSIQASVGTDPYKHPDAQCRFRTLNDVDIRGRSKTLQVNYRTSHQIRKQADMLLGPEVTDAIQYFKRNIKLLYRLFSSFYFII